MAIRPLRQPIQVLRQKLAQAREHPGQLAGWPTGLHSLDQKVGGLHAGEVVVLAARPGQGKTALAWQVAINVARLARDADVPGQVLFACGEMHDWELVQREVARETGISILQLRQGEYTDDQDLVIDEILEDIETLPIHIIGGELDLTRVETTLQQLPGGPLLLVLDYLQQIRGTGSSYTVISEAMHRIRRLRDGSCKETPILVLAQLHRPRDGGEDVRPQMTDIRDTGVIEEVANAVWLIHNPTVIPNAPPNAQTQIIVAKNRQGWTGNVTLEFVPHEVQFRDPQTEARPTMAPEQEQEPCDYALRGFGPEA